MNTLLLSLLLPVLHSLVDHFDVVGHVCKIIRTEQCCGIAAGERPPNVKTRERSCLVRWIVKFYYLSIK